MIFKRFPTTVKIGWKLYHIQIIDAVLNNGPELYGQIDFNGRLIRLRAANTAEQNEVTLIHEILHGISEMYDLDLEEHTVEVLCNALYTLLCDNIAHEHLG